MLRQALTAAFIVSLMPAAVSGQVNYGGAKPVATNPFVVTPVATFDVPWKLAFLPDQRILVTDKPGKVWLVTPGKNKIEVTGVPPVRFQGQGGLLSVAVGPSFASDNMIYLSYSEPGEGGSGLALARGKLVAANGAARIEGMTVIWRDWAKGEGGQFGAYIAFAPDGKSLFLTSGERQRFTPAQDPSSALGKILHLTLDGKPAANNPGIGRTGATTLSVFDPPADTIAAETAPAHKVTVPAPNLVPAETWTSGHRNQYGLAFDAAGTLWETEMGPMGGDELNVIEPGKNYGWPLVSYGKNYNGKPIPSPEGHPEFQKPTLYWTPVIAPGGLSFYYGSLFPAWKGSAFIGSMAALALIRVSFDGGTPREAERFAMGKRIRDVVAGPDGALWLLEDGKGGRLLRLTPSK